MEPEPHPPKPASREERKEQTRQRLLDAARTLFAERGFAGVSTAEIARAAGVTERTLFRHFPSKISLVFDEANALLPDMLRIIRERPARENAYQAVCEGILEFGREHPGLLVTIVGAPPGATVPADSRNRPKSLLDDSLPRTLRERYRLPADDVRATVWARASIAALRTALEITERRAASESTGEVIRDCFAALAIPPADADRG